jgi:peptidylprolyl isomerase
LIFAVGKVRCTDITKPEVDYPEGAPPKALEITGIWEGDSKVAAGDTVEVHYVRVGGRRKLVIPPDLGYGGRGAGGAIKPGETLIFACDLVSA